MYLYSRSLHLNISKILCFGLLASLLLLFPYYLALADTASRLPPLHAAVKNKDTTALQKLLATGESLEHQDARGWTALMYATSEGKEKMVSLLLEAGASVHINDRWSRNPLHLAADAPTAVVRSLIKAGAELDKRNSGGITPLMLAAGNGRQDIVDILLRAGARLNLKDYQSNSIVDWARRSDNPGLVKKLEAKIATLSEQPTRAKSENFAEDVFVDVEFPDWFKTSFLDLDVDLEQALNANKQGLMIFISTRRCSYCKAFIENSLTLPDIHQRVQESFDVIGLEIFDDSMMTAPDGKHYRVKEYVSAQKAAFTPTMIFYGAGARKLLKIVGYYPPEKFRSVLDYLQGGHYENESLRSFTSKKNRPGKKVTPIKTDHELFTRPPHILDRRAANAERPLLVLFEEPDCDACERLHRRVLADNAIRRLIGRYEAVQLDASDTDTRVLTPKGKRLSPKAWFAKLDLTYRPALVFFDKSGEEVLRLDSETQRYRMEGTLQLVLEKGYENDAQLQRWRRDKAVEFYRQRNSE